MLDLILENFIIEEEMLLFRFSLIFSLSWKFEWKYLIPLVKLKLDVIPERYRDVYSWKRCIMVISARIVVGLKQLWTLLQLNYAEEYYDKNMQVRSFLGWLPTSFHKYDYETRTDRSPDTKITRK